MSGAVGTFANIPPEICMYDHLGIDTASVSTKHYNVTVIYIAH